MLEAEVVLAGLGARPQGVEHHRPLGVVEAQRRGRATRAAGPDADARHSPLVRGDMRHCDGCGHARTVNDNDVVRQGGDTVRPPQD
jgi:hypothetical protein